MIDHQTEQLVTFSQATDELPRRRRGRKTSVSTIYRWATAGSRGIVLESLRVGGSRCTSREALQRFFEALTRASGMGNAGEERPGSIPISRSLAQRRRQSEEAAQRLIARGA